MKEEFLIQTRQVMGDDRFDRFMQALGEEPSVSVRVNPLKAGGALFEAQGIKVDDQQFTCRGSMGPIQAGHPNQQDLENLRSFVKKTV